MYFEYYMTTWTICTSKTLNRKQIDTGPRHISFNLYLEIQCFYFKTLHEYKKRYHSTHVRKRHVQYIYPIYILVSILKHSRFMVFSATFNNISVISWRSV